MAGTSDNWTVTKVSKSPGRIYSGLAIPSAGARMTLDADGTPDSTANPNAVHLGMTKEGVKLLVKKETVQDFADEFAAPIRNNISLGGMAIEGSLLQVLDWDTLEVLAAGVGTKGSGTGYEEMTIGALTIAYSSVAVIFPTEADSSKVAVFHIYKGFSALDIDLNISRQSLAEIPFRFEAYEVPTRADADTLGNFWQET